MKVFCVGHAKATAGVAIFVAAAAGAGVTAGCDGDEGTGSTTTTTTTTTSSTGSGEGGGGGSTGTGGGGGGGGGSASTCLDPSMFADLFTIEDAGLCAVGVYTADAAIAGYASSPTWGSHKGLLTVAQNDDMMSIDVTRWSTPSGATGKLVGKTTTAKTQIQGNWYLGAQAIDLPFFGWTAVSWSPPFPDTTGEVILLSDDAVAARYAVNGFFSGAGLGAVASGRLLYSGLSALEDTAGSANGLYAADTCGAPGQDPRLIPKGDAACAAPGDVSLWGDSSGPVAADKAGNVIAVMSSFGTSDQEARGFEASTVAKGAGKTDGVTLFKIPGFGTALAALSPDATGMGLVAFQPNDSQSFDALDVIEQRYSKAAGALKAEGTTSVLLKLTTPNTGLSMTADDQDRLWVSGPMGATGTLIVVLQRVSK